jgi:hypothetical protein
VGALSVGDGAGVAVEITAALVHALNPNPTQNHIHEERINFCNIISSPLHECHSEPPFGVHS